MCKEIPIFYACDDNFIKYTVVSLFSIKENASRERKYHVYVLHHGVTEENKEPLLSLEDNCFTITFVDVGDYLNSIEEKLPLRHYYTKTTYFRFFIAEMFPCYDKAIYIDSDTVCNGDISLLFDTEMGNCYLAACHEQAMIQTAVFGDYCEKVVGVSRHLFFNAGLMLINCAAFREYRVLDKFITLLGEYDFIVTQDEDYLNVICKDHVYWLDQRWNTEVTEGLTYPYDPSKEAHILHYIMANKPWHYESSVSGEVFWQYAARTPVYAILRKELAAYDDEKKKKDRQSAEHLKQMAIKETEREDNYQKLLNQTKRNADRVRVLQKIEEYERAGTFDKDVEEDPPTRMLMPNEIDYLRKSPIAKVQTLLAYCKAKIFLRYILKERLMIIKEIRGLSHLSDLRSGAVITCNHFNPFDTFALHHAYLASGQKKRKLYRVIREGNYTSFPGFYGYLMRHFYTLPLSSNTKTMSKFIKATDTLLQQGNFVLIYPEQSMWWNYRKPKPLKPGAFRFSAQNGVPVLPCFITMADSEEMGRDGFPIQEYTIHILPPIFPKEELSKKENITYLMEENTRLWNQVYESAYGIPPQYPTSNMQD